MRVYDAYSTRHPSSAQRGHRPSASTTPSPLPTAVPHQSNVSSQATRNTLVATPLATSHAGNNPRAPYSITTCRPSDQKAMTNTIPSTRTNASRMRDRP